MNWTPLGADPETHHTLVEGLPSYLKESVREWFEGEFPSFAPGREGVRAVERMRRYDLASRQRPHADGLRQVGPASEFGFMEDDEILRLMDWVVYDNARGDSEYESYDSENLEAILRAGGSAWKVGMRNGVAGLERRVPEGVQVAAEAAMATPGDAGRLLSEAWQAVYGVNPQPDLGYRKSIESVEAVVLPLVMKNDATATLGKAIGQMRSQGDWKLPFIKEHADNPTQKVVLGMMQALWSGHSDRHPGTSNYVQSTQEAAEAAVSLAVTLVNLFSNGGIARRP